MKHIVTIYIYYIYFNRLTTEKISQFWAVNIFDARGTSFPAREVNGIFVQYRQYIGDVCSTRTRNKGERNVTERGI